MEMMAQLCHGSIGLVCEGAMGMKRFGSRWNTVEVRTVNTMDGIRSPPVSQRVATRDGRLIHGGRSFAWWMTVLAMRVLLRPEP
jgi:hypothetical protein